MWLTFLLGWSSPCHIDFWSVSPSPSTEPRVISISQGDGGGCVPSVGWRLCSVEQDKQTLRFKLIEWKDWVKLGRYLAGIPGQVLFHDPNCLFLGKWFVFLLKMGVGLISWLGALECFLPRNSSQHYWLKWFRHKTLKIAFPPLFWSTGGTK